MSMYDHSGPYVVLECHLNHHLETGADGFVVDPKHLLPLHACD